MSDEDLLINVNKEADEAVVPKTRYAMVAATTPRINGDLDFDFRVLLPEETQIMEFLSFLFLVRAKVDVLYRENLENAINAYLDLREGVGADAARADIESYLAATITVEDVNNPAGLRDVEDDED